MLFDLCRLDRIQSCREALRQQAQIFGVKAVAIAFQNREFCCLDGDLFPGWFACHNPTAGERLPNEPVIDCQGAFDHLSSL